MSDNKMIDMTEGKPLPIIIRFSLPLVLSAFFQQLYSFVDSIIVGRFIGTDALAAVNLTGSINWVIMGITMGSALGFCIPFAQSVGAKDDEAISEYFWNGLYLAILLAVVASLITVPLTPTILGWINTPDTLSGMSSEYLRIILAGMTATTLYNYSAGILRALGDSRTPFRFLLISSAVNIVLDAILIIVFDMGVAGAAIATVFSQVLSFVMCMIYLFVRMHAIKTIDKNGKGLCGIKGGRLKTLAFVGIPMGFELSVNGIGSVILQACVNTLGVVAVSAVAAAEKIRSMITLPLENLGSAMSTYTAQNYGAKKTNRITAGIKSSLIILVSYCAFAWLLVLVLKRPLTYLMLGVWDGEVFDSTVLYLGIISCLFVFHGALQIFRNIIQGMGHSTAAVLSGVMEIIGRVIAGGLAVRYAAFKIVCLANPLAWLLAGAYCIIMTAYYVKMIQKNGYQT